MFRSSELLPFISGMEEHRAYLQMPSDPEERHFFSMMVMECIRVIDASLGLSRCCQPVRSMLTLVRHQCPNFGGNLCRKTYLVKVASLRRDGYVCRGADEAATVAGVLNDSAATPKGVGHAAASSAIIAGRPSQHHLVPRLCGLLVLLLPFTRDVSAWQSSRVRSVSTDCRQSHVKLGTARCTLHVQTKSTHVPRAHEVR